MSDPFISLAHRTDCYHCRKIADQLIRATPYRAEVACDNCGATRVFVPRIEDVVQPGTFVKPECYPTWKLAMNASCRNCHGTHPHDLTIGCRNFTVRCSNCNFTHFYKFDLEYMAKDLPQA
ncbi:MAG TPA: hypothetical protein P5217_07980 [Methanoregulaceae archaeon]|nr:hypothetical protein [Methanoregulaceae archaeon]HPD75944.1 hypothetical protein [Methanoregulaceae archaeon]HRY76206.1 hypothetical protein [Methanoregulaceae archaeon]